MTQEEKIIKHLKQAVSAFEKGISLFENNNYSEIPGSKKEEILACCKECSKNMNAAQELDSIYSKVYQHFSDGGNESNCRIAKNRWCFAKIEFAKSRIKDLSSKK
jgi:hypothetical protein